MADSQEYTEAVCIHTRKIYDSCRDKDCVEDLRVYPTVSSQPYIESAFSVRPASATLLYASVDVDEISFNRGYFTVDVTYFYEVTGQTFPGENQVQGLCVFNKRVMLFGSEGSAKVYSSDGTFADSDTQPVAVVECVNPIALNMKLVDACPTGLAADVRDIPPSILAHFGEDLVLSDGSRMLMTTLGQFSIIRLERDTQLVVPVHDYCLPDKECISGTEDDPCSMFSRIRFPVEEFFPQDSIDAAEVYRSAIQNRTATHDAAAKN
ncbi:MAG: hypothetical protein LJU34_06090 [Oscillospiraceae bacterium]|nr:hypothetical protein [Oscillospiraceae bacterium]